MITAPAWLTSARSILRALLSRLDRIHLALAAALLLGLATVPLLSAWPLFVFDLLALILFVVSLALLIALAGLFALRPRRLAARYRQQPDRILWREGLAYYLWFALFHLAIIDLLLGLSLVALWFYGPTRLTLALCCGLHASAALTAMGLITKPRAGLSTLGLLWRGPMPQSPLAFLERLFAVLFLSRRYAHGLVQDRQQDAPVLVEITRTLDSARVGVKTRATSLWRDGFARWQGEFSGRLWACSSLSSSTMVLALFLILILPQAQFYPDFLPGQPGRFALWGDPTPEKGADQVPKPEDQQLPDLSPADLQNTAEEQADADQPRETSEASADTQDRQASTDDAEPSVREPQSADPSARTTEAPADPSASRDPATSQQRPSGQQDPSKPNFEPSSEPKPQAETERPNSQPQAGAQDKRGSQPQIGIDRPNRGQPQSGAAGPKGGQPQAGADRQHSSPSPSGTQGPKVSQQSGEQASKVSHQSGEQASKASQQSGEQASKASQQQANPGRPGGDPSQARQSGQSQKQPKGDNSQSAPSSAPGQKPGAASESKQAQPGSQGQARPGSPQPGAAAASSPGQKPGPSASSQSGSPPPSAAPGAKPGAAPGAAPATGAQGRSQLPSSQTAPGSPKPGSEGGGNKPGSGTPSAKSAQSASASNAPGQGRGEGKADPNPSQNGETRSGQRQASDPRSPNASHEQQAIANQAGRSGGSGQVRRNYPAHADALLTVELPPMEEQSNLKLSGDQPEPTWSGKASSESDQQAPHQDQGQAKDKKPRVVIQRLPNWVVPLLPAKNQPPTPE